MAMNSIKISSTSDLYRQNISIHDKFHLTVDEPQDLGGDDKGATPVELVLAGLGSCKAITLQMYAERKGWDLANIEVDVSHKKVNRKYQILVSLALKGNLSEEQKQRLLQIADKCPVHKLLQASAEIETVLI